MSKNFYCPSRKKTKLITLLICTSLFAGCMNQSEDVFLILPNKANVTDPQSFYVELKPGSAVDEEILLINKSATSKEINLALLDALVPETTSPSFKLDTAEQKAFGAWGTLSENPITLPPHSSKVINLHLAVPSNTETALYKGGIQYDSGDIGTDSANDNASIKQSIRSIKLFTFKVTNEPASIEKQAPLLSPASQMYFIFSLIAFIIGLVAFVLYFKKTKRQ